MGQKEYKGYKGNLILSDRGVTIERGAKVSSWEAEMIRGDKTIPYSSIVAVQLKKAGMVAGYLQLTLMGGSEAKRGLLESVSDENTINFHSMGDNNQEFEEARQIIEQRILASKSGVVQQKSDTDELAKIAELRDKGIIAEEEVQLKKKQILGL